MLGAWLYFTYQERDRALAEKTATTRTANADKKAMEVYQIVLDDLRMALGQQLTEDEKKAQDIKRKAYLDDNGGYKGVEEKNRPAYVKLLNDLRNDLGFDEATGEFKTTYPAKVKAASEEATANLASLKAIQKKLQDAEAMFKQLTDKQDAYFADSTNRFDKEQKTVLAAANKQTAEMTALIEVNRKLNDQIVQDDQKAKKAETSLRKQITELKAQLKAKEEERPEAVARTDNREPHALMLDMSLGKPLWDEPVGTVTRVDAKAKEVTINVGTARGVKPDLTFTVFAPSKFVATRAEKQMKGTIEVTRVLGPNTAAARITAQFDPDFPIHEGDLLFNLFWGTRVAIAGYVGVTGTPSDSPSEQMRQLGDFMYLCERQGIIVDAYLDLTDGQVKGAITPSTRYLIRGEDLRLDPKELENKDPRAERALAVNNAIAQMRKDAVEKGMFVISAKNFATVIGYRPPGAGREMPAFRPALPTAGSAVPSVGAGAPAERPMPPAAPEKKEEKNEKEGK